MVIRPERPNDVNSIRGVNLRAFDTHTEADLVDALRSGAAGIVSLLAEDLELTAGALNGRSGTIRYHPLFATI